MESLLSLLMETAQLLQLNLEQSPTYRKFRSQEQNQAWL